MTLLLGAWIINRTRVQSRWLVSGLHHTEAAPRRLFTQGGLFARLGERCLHREGGGPDHLALLWLCRGAFTGQAPMCSQARRGQLPDNSLSELLISSVRVNMDNLGKILKTVLSPHPHPHPVIYSHNQINHLGSFLQF